MAEDAIHEARGICMREKAAAPEVTVYGDPKFSFPYVPSHLHHMTFELVSCSCAGTYRMMGVCLVVRGMCFHGCTYVHMPATC